jgi:pimeloyl-ACP methyl ester carboxylesterase
LRKTIKYKGTDVVYSHSGGGKTIVLLHGFLEDRTMWNDYTSRWERDHQIIAIDLLGQGESGNLGYTHSMEEHALAVLSVLDAEQIGPCAVVGHSMGGYVALALAEKRPDQLTHLVLFHSTAFADSESKRQDRERVIDLAKRNKQIYIKAVIPSLFADQTRNGLSKEIEKLIEVANQFTTQGLIANLQGMKDRADRSKVLREEAFKKLIIHGEFDSVISLSDMKNLEALSPSIRLEVVSNIGHMGHFESPDECFALIDNMIAN